MIDPKVKENEKIHNLVAEKYNARHIEIYNKIEQSRIDLVIKNLLKKINNDSSIQVLDYWSWTWNLTKFFLQNSCEVTSLDISNESLDILKKLYADYSNNLHIKKFDWYVIPSEDRTFDIVATYSVLHHIPDYMRALDDMLRVIKIGWYIYLDHEHNINHWNPSGDLSEYTGLYNSFFYKLKSILFTWEVFEFNFWKGVFIRKFINPKYANEWDIHVWKDDYIDWEKIIIHLTNNWFEIIENIDYLQYHPYVSIENYNLYTQKVNNMKYIIARKK